MFEIPMQRWANAFLMHNWLANVNQMWHSDTVQRRVIQGSNPVIQEYMKANNLTPSIMTKLVHAGFWLQNRIDAYGTAVSSAIVYTDAINQGMTEEQALEKMDVAVAKFSQPILEPSKAKSLLNPAAGARLYLMFMADPTLKTSLAMEGAMEISRGNWEKGVRNIMAVEAMSLVSQFILNLWQAAGLPGAEPDKDDKGFLGQLLDWKKFLRAAILAPFQGLFIMGNMAEGALRAVFSERVFPAGTPITAAAVNVHSALKHIDDFWKLDWTDPDFRKEVDRIVKSVGIVTGGVTGGITSAGAGAWHTGRQTYNWITGETDK
jgi:hypothetical protein